MNDVRPLEVLGITEDGELALPGEVWKDIAGYEGFYAVSNLGRVMSIARVVPGRPGVFGIPLRTRILKPGVNDSGYLHVTLRREAKRSTQKIHCLVMAAFVGPRPAGLVVCHTNGDQLDNRASNLRYDTVSANTFDRVRHGTHSEARKTHCPQSHAYDEANTYRHAGKRRCRTCDNLRSAARRSAS